MRFAELNLLAYGHFTERRLVFTPGNTDLHIVFGANEAGKSTARSAVGDFLFGFPTQTPLNFLHAYNALRIGARIQADDTEIAAIRKKGRKNTLLDANGDPANGLDTDLERQLAGADRAFFTRMFSLDHDGLRAGGETLAAADANADTALLSAGSGLADVLAERDALVAEADALWSPNASQNRRYYQAEARLKAADADIREHEVTVGDWRSKREAFETAEARYNELAEQRRGLSHQWRELERIRRVAQPARRYREIEAELADLGDAPALHADARAAFEQAKETIESANAAIASIEDQIERIDAEIATLADDPALREAGEAIERLAEQRGRIAADRERSAEIEREQAHLAEALAHARRELGWPDETSEWPTAAALAQVRRLAAAEATHRQSLEHATDNLNTAREADARLAAEADALGGAADTTALDAWLAACTREGDLESEWRNAQAGVDRLERDLARRLAAMQPAVADIETLATLHVPARDRIDEFEAAIDTARESRQQQQARVDELSDEVERARDALARRRADEALPSAESLTATREKRDACWQLVRRRYVEQRERDLFDEADAPKLDADAEKNPVETFERTTREADALADARFDHAEAIAQDAERQRHVAEREQALEQATARRDEARTRLDGLQMEWTALWASADLKPASPAAMRDWLDRRDAALAVRADRIDAEAKRDDLAERIAAHRDHARPYLVALGVDESQIADASLAVLIEHARRLVEREHRKRDDRQRLDRERGEQARRIEALQSTCEQAEATLADWQHDWRAALDELGLDASLDAQAGQAALDVIETGRQHARQARDLAAEQHDLNERRSRFEAELARILEATGRSAAVNEPGEQTVQRLTAALRDTRSQHERLQTRQADLAAHRERIAQHEQTRAEAERRLDGLCRQAGVADPDALEAIIARAERRQALIAEHTATAETLTDQGDGQSIDDLIAAVEASDLDTLREQIDALSDQIDNVDADLGPARDARNEAKAAFDAIGGDDRAVTAAAERQTALADMQDAAERYLRVGPAALLLKWAGQRYAMDKHRPLIERGSVLMDQLTGGSFERLAGEFDDRDELQIVGVRPDGSRVAPIGMSEGTRDQLYLALRIAAIEDYLERAAALPVVADDLFINFDDDRAMAGLDALAGLAEKTQVLFFTHHQHLRDMAVERLGGRINTHDL
ncbi:ATP-binding protein [Salinisphaera hydrothermalis]|uniref:ATP-binding protein n=1 Tax=Salinisphaera hydrothermalis TaxID=563188 RepID=UPI003340AA1C